MKILLLQLFLAMLEEYLNDTILGLQELHIKGIAQGIVLGEQFTIHGVQVTDELAFGLIHLGVGILKENEYENWQVVKIVQQVYEMLELGDTRGQR